MCPHQMHYQTGDCMRNRWRWDKFLVISAVPSADSHGILWSHSYNPQALRINDELLAKHPISVTALLYSDSYIADCGVQQYLQRGTLPCPSGGMFSIPFINLQWHCGGPRVWFNRMPTKCCFNIVNRLCWVRWKAANSSGGLENQFNTQLSSMCILFQSLPFISNRVVEFANLCMDRDIGYGIKLLH